MVHESMAQFMNGYPRNAHPMAVLTGLIGGMAAFYPDSLDVNSEEQHELSLLRLIAKMPTLIAMIHTYSKGGHLCFQDLTFPTQETFCE